MKHYPRDRDQKADQQFAAAQFIAVWTVLALAAFGLIVTLAPISETARAVLTNGWFGRAFIWAGVSLAPAILVAYAYFIEHVELIDLDQ